MAMEDKLIDRMNKDDRDDVLVAERMTAEHYESYQLSMRNLFWMITFTSIVSIICATIVIMRLIAL